MTAGSTATPPSSTTSAPVDAPDGGPRRARSWSLRGGRTSDWVRQRGVYVALVLLVAFNVVATPNFTTLGTIQLLAVQTSVVILVSLGMALVIGTGGVDLSVGAIMAITAAVTAKAYTPDGYGLPIGIAIVLAILVATLVGAFNGTVVAAAGVQPIVATLAMLVGGRGLALMITGGALVEMFPPFFGTVRESEHLGLPDIFWLAVAFAAAASVLLRRTAFGYRLLAIGGNLQASRLAGLPVPRTTITVYALSGLLAGVAGVISTARIRAADPSYVGLGIELTAITAVVIGGTLLNGGQVRILGTVAGAILIQLLENTLVSQGARDSIARIIEAVIIIAAVLLQRPWRSAT